MKVGCTGWHSCIGLCVLGLASMAQAQEGVTEDLASPEAPPPPVQVERPEGAEAVPTREAPRERYWRMPRSFVERPLTLPEGVLRISSPRSFVMVPGGTGSAFRFSTFLNFGVGVMDDWEIGATPFGWTFLTALHDPTVYTRVRVLSGEVQIALRGELALPVTDQASAWMNLAVELAWSPNAWFRFETAVDYGLHFVSPLQQTIYVPLRAVFQAGPNSFALTSGAVMYNDADDFDVPILVRYAHSLSGGFQGPLMDVAIEGGVADVTNAERSWLVRLNWTWFAYL